MDELNAILEQAMKGGSKSEVRKLPAGLIGDLRPPSNHDEFVATKTVTSYQSLMQPLELSRVSFNSNILRSVGAAEHWMVLFCYSWYAPCKELMQPWTSMATTWQAQLNTDLFTRKIRFAHVDCARDRVLCNERDVEGLPHVQHYVAGSVVGKFTGDKDSQKRLSKWLTKQLAPPVAPAATLKAMTKEMGTVLRTIVLILQRLPAEPLVDVLIIIVILFLNLRAICQNPTLWRPQVAPQVPKAAEEKEAACEMQSLAPPSAITRCLPGEWAQDRAPIDL